MKANLKYKLAESFCRNFALQSRNIAKTILAVFIESNEMTSSWWKNSFNIFCEAKKWKCSNLSRQKSWIAVKLWRDWSQVIASFLEIKTFSSHSLMDCAVKQCIQHAYPRSKYESYDQTVWGKKGPNKFLQVPNVGLHVRWTCGQHALTKCEKMLKKRWFFG